jgi:hypothetical protein
MGMSSGCGEPRPPGGQSPYCVSPAAPRVARASSAPPREITPGPRRGSGTSPRRGSGAPKWPGACKRRPPPRRDLRQRSPPNSLPGAPAARGLSGSTASLTLLWGYSELRGPHSCGSGRPTASVAFLVVPLAECRCSEEPTPRTTLHGSISSRSSHLRGYSRQLLGLWPCPPESWAPLTKRLPRSSLVSFESALPWPGRAWLRDLGRRGAIAARFQVDDDRPQRELCHHGGGRSLE